MEDRQCMWGFVRVLGWKTGSVCVDLLGCDCVRVEDMQCMWGFVSLLGWKTGSVCVDLLGCEGGRQAVYMGIC